MSSSYTKNGSNSLITDLTDKSLFKKSFEYKNKFLILGIILSKKKSYLSSLPS